MDFTLSEEHQMFREMFRDFAEKEVAKVAEQTDKTEQPPVDLLKKAAAQGFLGATIPEQYGGAGLDYLAYALMLEEIAKHCVSTAVTLGIHVGLSAMSILDAGTEAQKEKYLPPLAAGERLGTFALTEPDAGTDSAGVQTTARLHDDGYVLNGVKSWASNGGLAGVYVIIAATDGGAGAGNGNSHNGPALTAFIIDKDNPGLFVGHREPTLGMRGVDIRTLYLDDCLAPLADRLGEEGAGGRIVQRTFNRGRLGLAAIALGAAESALALGTTFAAERQQFGGPIAHKQAIQNMIADSVTEIEALRGLVYRAAWMADSGQDLCRAASIAKYFGARTAKEVANRMLQVHGGYGFSEEYTIARLYRDVRALRIIGGTDEIQRFVIAREQFEEKGLLIKP